MNDKISVLIADDNCDFANELAEFLKTTPDITVVAVANDGNEALSLIEETSPDVAILDIIMPERDGLSVLKKLSESKAKKPICIMFSVTGSSGIMDTAMQLGADYYLLKPQKPQTVAEVIRLFTGHIDRKTFQ